MDCTCVSMANNMFVMVVSLFSRLDGEKPTTGDPGVRGASAKATPSLRFGGPARGHWVVHATTGRQGVVR